MENKIKQITLRVKMAFIAYCIAIFLVILCGECDNSWIGIYASDVRATYLAETITILLTAICVPVSLKLFAWFLKNKISEMSINQALDYYFYAYVIRLLLLFLPVFAGLLTYYLTLSNKGVLCVLLILTATLFCLPGKERLRRDLHIDKEE